ncbi:hypothetical protein [Enterobacter hormaechei]|uniref:hypothetical protein n=1 Tax=Enterobacter hormaechei TaxID=158836 RepID=UPI000755B0C5|nr:hypothetical protein [Enterobacter hormaechei]KVJ54062.1 hypothetical protein AWS30_23870 [Enterobacter hormaechei subsp. xiangfangensis]
MKLFEMEGFLRGKCIPRDLKVNETNAEYLVRKFAEADAKCAALAAENAGLKELIEQHANSVAVCPNCSHEEPSETDDIVALYRSMETPATDAFLAEVRAQGVEMLASLAGNECQRYKSVNDRSGARKWKSIVILCTDFAAQLRKGVQS